MVSNSIQTKTDCILCLALDIGEGMLKNGDSVHHVEDTIKRICRSYGGVHIETFVISSLILASVRMEDGSYSSQIRRVYDSVNNMSALESFNRLSRRICAETPDFDIAQEWLREIKTKKPYPLWLSLLGHAFVGIAFAVLFGGSIRDGLACALVGLVLGILSHLRLGNMNSMAKTLLLSFVAGLLAYGTVLIRLGQNVDMIMIGSIMLLIPGIALGNALRDLLYGDILTGVLKTVQSCLSAILIACGYSGAILIMTGFNLNFSMPPLEHHFLVNLLVATLGTVAFGAVFRVRQSCLWLTALGGGGVYAVYCLAEYFGAPLFVCALCCAVAGAAYSELCARLCKLPAIVFLTPVLVPIVPGGALYYAMSALIGGNKSLLFEKSAQTLYISAGLVVGTIAVTVITGFIKRKPKTNR